MRRSSLRRSRRRPYRGLASAAIALLVPLSPASAGPAAPRRAAETSDGMRLVDSLSFEGGSEIAVDDRFVYANQLDGTTARGQYPDRGGIRLVSSRGGRVVQHGSLHCPGNDNDVQPLDRDLFVVAHHTNRCNPGPGLLVVDATRPASPRVVGRLSLPGGMAHTVTPHPRSHYVYVSPGGFFNGKSEEVIVDVSDARRPRVAATFVPGPAGCHDFSFLERGPQVLGFCAGLAETSIWDVSDPLSPVLLARIHNPAIEFMYVALPSPDGRLLAIVDEAFAAHECRGGQGPGGVWLYDIEEAAVPVPVGRITTPSRGASPVGTPDVTTWCAAHGIAWHPRTPGLLAVTWYTAGIGVYDVTSVSAVREVAHFVADDSLTEAVAWHRGLLYSNDLRRGVDVFSLER